MGDDALPGARQCCAVAVTCALGNQPDLSRGGADAGSRWKPVDARLVFSPSSDLNEFPTCVIAAESRSRHEREAARCRTLFSVLSF